ncbi:hypothetical protein [Paraburkholderia humisilvae]|uniref:Uncharacterized protein n=1 Tax=Paraburkholderia humisilvae TaxID=627669 RepID=A0A6J5EW28_9BURK|nr:hypothetical protein [Paraburkholderia humisilvae]CAB3770808.1 hypothetical protein LMG29542_06447 [Paraburkholderia humisilvae]
MQQPFVPVPCPDAYDSVFQQHIVGETVSAVIGSGRATGQFRSWQIKVWTSEKRMIRRAHLRILWGDTLWQRADWILDWPAGGRSVH